MKKLHMEVGHVTDIENRKMIFCKFFRVERGKVCEWAMLQEGNSYVYCSNL